MMPREPKGDPTSLGNILIEWDIIDEEQLNQALQEQETLRGDDLLGRLLVASGACTEEEVNTAMSAQASLRATKKHKCAMAVADLALERRRRDSVILRRKRISDQAEAVRKTITGDNHQALTPAMLAKPADS
jgi:hypothetical protein